MKKYFFLLILLGALNSTKGYKLPDGVEEPPFDTPSFFQGLAMSTFWYRVGSFINNYTGNSFFNYTNCGIYCIYRRVKAESVSQHIDEYTSYISKVHPTNKKDVRWLTQKLQEKNSLKACEYGIWAGFGSNIILDAAVNIYLSR